jgi:Fic family protein
VQADERRDRAARQRLLQRVRAEFQEVPGLVLTLPQAERLFGIREDTCRRVLETLVRDGVLRPLADGLYGRRDVSR